MRPVFRRWIDFFIHAYQIPSSTFDPARPASVASLPVAGD
jgi:hypothetical protein